MGSGEGATRSEPGGVDAARKKTLGRDAQATERAVPQSTVNLSFPETVDAKPAVPDAGRPLALLSFDVEQFDIPTEYGIDIDVDKQFEIGRAGLATVLELLDKHEAPATFFITAEFAQRYTRLVRTIVERSVGGGRHEIASLTPEPAASAAALFATSTPLPPASAHTLHSPNRSTGAPTATPRPPTPAPAQSSGHFRRADS